MGNCIMKYRPCLLNEIEIEECYERIPDRSLSMSMMTQDKGADKLIEQSDLRINKN
jgi:hypothetical protein